MLRQESVEGESNLGSLKGFAKANGYDHITHEVFDLYTESLARNRQKIASSLGISLEELHSGSYRYLGKIGLDKEISVQESSIIQA